MGPPVLFGRLNRHLARLRNVFSSHLQQFLPVLALLLAVPAAGHAQAPDWTLCRRTIAAVEPGAGLPPGLLLAVAQIESGRPLPGSGRSEPWPWSWNVEGESHVAETREAAIAAVAALRQAGRASVDVGCMQVNLKYHPAAFADLPQGFDAEANVRYAARFLRELYARSGNWAEAIGQYHSGDPARGAGYQRRVLLARLGARLVNARAAAGLCAPGLKPQMVVRGMQPRMVCRR